MLSRILGKMFRALISTPIFVRRKEHTILNHLAMDSGIRRICKSSSPISMHGDSMLKYNVGLIYSQMPASKLSSMSMAFWVGPRSQSATTPLLSLSDISQTRRWVGGWEGGIYRCLLVVL